MKGLGSPLIWRGILADVVGVIAAAWPGITIGAFIILFAVYTFVAARMEAVRAFRSETVGPVAGQWCCRSSRSRPALSRSPGQASPRLLS